MSLLDGRKTDPQLSLRDTSLPATSRNSSSSFRCFRDRHRLLGRRRRARRAGRGGAARKARPASGAWPRRPAPGVETQAALTAGTSKVASGTGTVRAEQF